jgi:hypothetical protein
MVIMVWVGGASSKDFSAALFVLRAVFEGREKYLFQLTLTTRTTKTISGLERI